jgi:hypothetical protein
MSGIATKGYEGIVCKQGYKAGGIQGYKGRGHGGIMINIVT